MRVQPLQVGQRPDPLVPDEDDEEEGGLPEGDGQEAHHAIGHDAMQARATGVCTISDLPDAGHWTFGLGLTSDIYEVILTGVGFSND